MVGAEHLVETPFGPEVVAGVIAVEAAAARSFSSGHRAGTLPATYKAAGSVDSMVIAGLHLAS